MQGQFYTVILLLPTEVKCASVFKYSDASCLFMTNIITPYTTNVPQVSPTPSVNVTGEFSWGGNICDTLGGMADICDTLGGMADICDTLGGMAEATDEQTKDVHCHYVKPPLLLWGLNNTHTG